MVTMRQGHRKRHTSVILAIAMALLTVICQLYLFSLFIWPLSIYDMVVIYSLLVGSGIIFALFCTQACRRIATDQQSNPAWLRPVLASLAKRMCISEPELHTLNTSGINAFALQGIIDHGHILINSDTLTHLHEDEIEAVLAHECSHIISRHALAMTLVQGMTFPLTLPIAAVLSIVYGFIFGMENFRHMFLTLHQLLTIILFPLTTIGIAIFTRIWELDADRQAAKVIGIEKYIAALKCLHGSFFQHPNLLNLPADNPGQAGQGWALSHPNLRQRIHALLEIGQS